MKLSPKVLKILLVVVVLGFGIGFYLQDVKHEESTAHAWKANRYNLERFNKIMEYNNKMNSSNWRVLKDSIDQELDTLMILRFRKEVDSLENTEPQAYGEHQEQHASFGPQ
ncbi:MAG: hypothetical protein ABJO28_10760 [Maribacter dokdonensis]|uniref:Uncharacterized protein n=1 Tax=Maribacter dokdonensis TaxID=320912 RepID=A0ABY0USF6_9FLAO|nr:MULTISPECIES: hypothetical protein [Maribacter]HAF79132.1 hypothetical protein [Maribacter sp.]APA64801.1 hypothetical protein YQ22_11015 [Maribacter sp. 1_2014MBL_MicDiv]KSA15080.1 hypothetical protein I600_1688 [Maribacter dokdonensis DSW-8]MBU2900196.1 hypothetical protein [Maribacter dokdonensis]MDP2525634.1 hypothetical protein [Maribacter dokdonensis]|tara:strand:+ start:76 stop:408 length:333 start_codon:yes stop_codon:yes gene_type:complete